jgi:hypothetical protein
MAEINWGLLNYDPVKQQAQSFSYADRIAQSAAQRQAGTKFAAGDYTGAAQTQAAAGDIPAATQTQQFAQKTAASSQAYLAQALPVFQGVLKAHANDPDGGAQALGDAFDHLAPEVQAATGGTPQDLAHVRQALVSDPNGTLAHLQSQLPVEWKTAGDSLVATRGPNIVSSFEGSKFIPFTAGGGIAQVGGGGQSASPTPQQSAPSPQPAPGSDAMIPGVNPSATAAVESGGNPNAVSPAGAVGTMQTMPGTLQSPGFGVAPARDNSAQEQTRVGSDYLAALNQHYGNPVLAHIAYNMGPGATDKWLASGGDFSKLPAETQTYLGRTAVAQAVPQGGQQQPAPQGGNGGIQILRQPTPVWRATTPEEQKQYPGAMQINANGEVKYPPSAVGAQQAASNVTLAQGDATSKSILAQTGLSNGAFQALIGNSSQLPRDAVSRARAQAEATKFANDRGVDTSTLQSQYKAYNNVLQNNLQKSNGLEILNNEVQGTVKNLMPVADALQGGNLRWVNGAAAFVGGLKNDPNAQKYAFYLNQLRADLAGFNAISGGKTDQHGNAHADDSDFREAESVIKTGIDSGGAQGLAQAVQATSSKNKAIVDDAATDANRNIWKLFGVGDNYDKVNGISNTSAAVNLQPGTKYKGLDVLSPIAAMKLPKGAGFYDTSGTFRVRK